MIGIYVIIIFTVCSLKLVTTYQHGAGLWYIGSDIKQDARGVLLAANIAELHIRFHYESLMVKSVARFVTNIILQGIKHRCYLGY